MRKTKYVVRLPEEERARLRTLIGRGARPGARLTHARILLKADQGEGGPGWTDAAIAGALEVHPTTVARVRRQYVERRAGRPRWTRKRPDRVYARKLDGAAGGAPGRPRLQRAAGRAASAGRCACWPTSWCALEVVDGRLARDGAPDA